MFFSKPKVDWKWYSEEVQELERLQHNVSFLNPVKIDSNTVKQIGVCHCGVADSINPIIATNGLYNCTGFLAYDLSKEYAFLAHSYGNEHFGQDNSISPSQIYDGNYYRIPRGVTYGSSIHVIEMLDTLSKKELYQLRVAIIVGSKPNVPLVSSMINTVTNLGKKNISIESIELTKPFIEGIHKINDVNHGKGIDRYVLARTCKDEGKNIVENEITGETHSYGVYRGSSFAFDSRDGRMFTYNSDTKQYYSYDNRPSIEIKVR